MTNDPRRVSFLKALIAAAWADGELSTEEIKTLSYYLERFQITEAEYSELQPLLDQALDPSAAQTLLEEQLQELATAEERRTLVAAVEDLLLADDKLDPAGATFLQGLRELTSHVPTAQLFISRLRALWAVAPARREGPRRVDEPMARFGRHRLLEYFRGRVALARARSGIAVDSGVSDSDLYRVVVWAGLLSQVAQADREFCPAEERQLLDLLAVTGDVPRPDLEVVVRAYTDGSLLGVDLVTLVREFLQIASPEESGLLLDSLFLVAAADGTLHERELRLIRQIAEGVGFGERSYVAALNRCKRRMAAGWN
jgi:uncharacterized tellurite resistance protein B-like protein